MSPRRLLTLAWHLPREGAFFLSALAKEEEPEPPRTRQPLRQVFEERDGEDIEPAPILRLAQGAWDREREDGERENADGEQGPRSPHMPCSAGSSSRAVSTRRSTSGSA